MGEIRTIRQGEPPPPPARRHRARRPIAPPPPPPAAARALEVLADYHAYTAFVLNGESERFATEVTGAPLPTHAARLAAELAALLAVLAAR